MLKIFTMFYILFLFLSYFLLYNHIIYYGWWTGDDPAILYFIVKNNVLKYFYDPSIWQYISTSNLTPWINLSLGVDYKLFGLNPHLFFLHQFISGFILIFTFYLILKEFFSRFPAFLMSYLFMLSVSVCSIIHLIWLRHYMEGFIFSSLAFLMYIKSIKNDSLVLSLIGSFFYAIALTAKEIYVPLVGILFLYPNSFRKRYIRNILSFILIAFLYVFWRVYMLGFKNIIITHRLPSVHALSAIDRLLILFKGMTNSLNINPLLVVLILSINCIIYRKKIKNVVYFIILSCFVFLPLMPAVDFFLLIIWEVIGC